MESARNDANRQPSTVNRQLRRSEAGFTLASLLVILTIIAVLLAYTVPRMWSDVLKRERDIQTAWTVKQYARAIAEFQRKRGGALPASLEQLKEQTTPRILRQLYPNPLSGELDWILLPPTTVSPIQVPGAPNAPQPTPPQTGLGGQPSGAPSTGLSGDYKGPFIGVRPPQTGDSYVAINGANRYEEWIYTINDLQLELNARMGGPGAGQPNVGTLPPRPAPSPGGRP